MKKIIYLFLFGLFSNLTLSAQITPWIESISPAQNAIAASTNTTIEITFSEEISTDLLQESISVYGSHNGFYSFTASVDGTNSRILIETDQHFKAGENIALTLSTSIKNLNGVQMPVPMTSNFQVLNEVSMADFHLLTPIATEDSPYSLTSSDFNGDGFLDLATANRGANSVNVLINNGDGNFTNTTSIQVGILPESIVSGDFDKDGDADIAVINSSNHNISILENTGNVSFVNAGLVPVGTLPHAINMGDLDGDGDLDLVTSNFSDATLSIVSNDGAGNFEETFTVEVGNLPEYAIVKDFDNDGDLDLASPSFTTSSLHIVDNIGNGEFENINTVGVGFNPHIPMSGDLDGDGFEDLIVPNSASSSLSILTNMNGEFTSGTAIVQSGGPWAGTTFDMDGDGDLDVAIPLYGNGQIQILENDGMGNLSPEGVYMVGNNPHVVISGDFDNNGTADLAVCNDGSNTVSILLKGFNTANHDIKAPLIKHRSFPNPFQSQVYISYELDKKMPISLEIYDVLGQHITTIFEGQQSAGVHQATWNGSNLDAGLYVYKIISENFAVSGTLSMF